ncbi:MAG: neutral/alkaline non-lysosomal ceramidase N-terminal domain-containing protein [Gammaproteobacteria bacterium]|nr:neutral/alkaline non-lysosomal ceramidase N-terminal domain-containing protein [Gammaproteobacteria bacterium]
MLIWLLGLSLLFVGVVGPWPNHELAYQQSTYYTETQRRLQQQHFDRRASPLQAGYGRVDITPNKAIALGGFNARQLKNFESVAHRVYAQAISLSNQEQIVTIIAVEWLLPLPDIIDAVAEKTGLSREQLFFTASHTHAGPGAYAKGLIGESVLGAYDAEYFSILADKLARVVLDSRYAMQPIQLQYQRIDLKPTLANQLLVNQLDDQSPAHGRIHLLKLLDQHQQNLAMLLSFGAHPTLLDATNHSLSGDYPGLLQYKLSQQMNTPVLFAAGAVAGIMPQTTMSQSIEKDQQKTIETYSDRLVSIILRAEEKPPSSAEFVLHQWQQAHAVIDSHLFNLDLPTAHFRISKNTRLSPYMVHSLFHQSQQSYVHLLRLGPVMLMGFPGDYSGELAQRLEQNRPDDLQAWAISFNGDYIGYLMPSDRYDQHHYTVTRSSVYGRWLGDYFTDIAQQALKLAH